MRREGTAGSGPGEGAALRRGDGPRPARACCRHLKQWGPGVAHGPPGGVSHGTETAEQLGGGGGAEAQGSVR